MSATIRRLRPDEASAISALAKRAKAHWGYPADFMAACQAELTYTAVELAAQAFHGIEADGTLVGFYGLTPLPAGECELDALFVEPAYIGQGYGRRLLAHALAASAEQGYTALLIQGDPHAAAFYRSAGAQRIGERESASVPGRMLPLFRLDLPT